MINWIMDQQLVLSLCIVLLIAMEGPVARKLGAAMTYQLWLLVPLVLLANNLPRDIVEMGPSTLHRYVVTVNEQASGWHLSLSWQMLWAAGAISIVMFAVLSHWELVRNSKRDVPQNVEGVPDHFRIEKSTLITSPIISGLLYPTITLPADFTDRFSVQQQTMILQHEVTHYRRGDTFYNLLALLTLAVCWFNPMVWFGYAAFRRCQEMACDAQVLSDKTKAEKVAYSQALLLCSTEKAYLPSIYSPYSEKNTMKKRLKQIQLKTSANLRGKALLALFSASMLGGVAVANQHAGFDSDKINEAQPVYRVEPYYPKQAAQERVQGSVVLRFDINADGSTGNIEVIKAEPSGVFDKNSVAALSQWKYKPRIVGGKAEKQPDMLVQLDYRLDAMEEPGRNLVEEIEVRK